jgi:hypothetical protein
MVVNSATNPLSQAVGSSNNFTVPSSLGNMQILTIVTDTNVTLFSVSDNKSNFYSIITGGYDVPNGRTFLAYSLSASSGITTLTLSFLAGSSGGVTLTAYDITTTTGGELHAVATKINQTSNNPSLTVIDTITGFTVSCLMSISTISAVSSPFVLENMDNSLLVNNATSAYNIAGNFTSTFTSATSGGWGGTIANFIEAPGTSAHTQIGYFLVGP